MCRVFAESEVISLISTEVKKIAYIAHGIQQGQNTRKAMSLLKHCGSKFAIFDDWRCCQTPGVVAVVKEPLGEKLHIYEEPEIVGALGAALLWA